MSGPPDSDSEDDDWITDAAHSDAVEDDVAE